MTITQPRLKPSHATSSFAVDNPTPALDADFLDRVALVSFQKLVLASGELRFPCHPALLDEQIALIRAVMEALGQRPPDSVLAHWRDLLAEKAIAAAAAPQATLRVTFHPAEPLLGLLGGFQVGITAWVDDHPETLDSPSPSPSLLAQTLAQGILRIAALPSLIDQHLRQMRRLLEALGQSITEDEVEGWRGAIAPILHQLFQRSPNAYLVVRYRVLDPAHGLHSGIALDISGEITSVEAEYKAWTQTRTGPLFGNHADAKVLDMVAQLGNPAECPILDIGAGTGRNSLALAQRGFTVDALELAPALAEQLTQAKTASNLSLNVIEGNILDPHLVLPHRQYKFIFLSEVIASHFRSIKEVHCLFVRLSDLLQPGGILLFNTFLAAEGYRPTPMVRELAQAFWSCVFTEAEMHRAMTNLPLQLLSDESVVAYEEAHLPTKVWPPTEWFLGWATGRNLFPTVEQPPIELRWLMWQKH